MKTKEQPYSVGVIVARFQIPALHPAHIDLINSVLEKHPKVLVFLGLSPTKGTISNPLDYQPRRQLVLEAFPPQKYPNISVGYIKDIPDDEKWSKNLDSLIADAIQPNDTVCLYGSRDSFVKQYTGRYPTRELVSERFISGTEIRNQIASAPQSHPFFRAGAIWATHQRYPTAYPTTDVLAYNADKNQVLLIRKEHEDLYRFPGGFVSPTDDSFEAAAVRELKEETGKEADPDYLIYLGSKRIDDWRYRNEKDKIITHFYIALNSDGNVIADDDAAEAAWFDLKSVKDLMNIRNLHLVKEHIPLIDSFKEKIIRELKLGTK